MRRELLRSYRSLGCPWCVLSRSFGHLSGAAGTPLGYLGCLSGIQAAHWKVLTVHCDVPAAHCEVQTTHCNVHTAHCEAQAAHCEVQKTRCTSLRQLIMRPAYTCAKML